MDPNNSHQPTQTVSPEAKPMQTISEQPSQPKAKLSKWVVIAIVVLAMIISGGISAFMLNKNNSTKSTQRQVNAVPTVSQIVSPTSFPTLATSVAQLNPNSASDITVKIIRGDIVVNKNGKDTKISS